jgi:shikimate kinase
MQKIILIGYMGSGKTTIAQLLAKEKNMNWIDLDDLIEKETQLSIATLFETKGEVYFRTIEHQLFKKVVEREENLIISTGGGTPCYANNHLLLKGEHVDSIYLKGSIDTLYQRLINEMNKRPLLANLSEEELKEYIAKSLFERSYFYNHATFKVDINQKTPETITAELLQLLN